MSSRAASRRLLRLGSLIFGASLWGCAPPLAVPPGFVEIEGAPYDFRASSADGLVISVRELEHDPEGDLTFWARAVENELRLGRGYALLSSRNVANAKGLEGRELRFGHDEGSKPHLYWVTIFVTKDTIYVVETGGTKELVDQNQQALEAAIRSLDAS